MPLAHRNTDLFEKDSNQVSFMVFSLMESTGIAVYTKRRKAVTEYGKEQKYCG
jgi:hypothetical protein